MHDAMDATTVADISYLAYVRPAPAPFTQFVSGHFPPGTSTQRHHHACIALHGCLQGPLILETARGVHSLEAGEFCLLAAGVDHHWRNHSRQTGATFGLLVDTSRPGHWPAATGITECCSRLERLVTGVHLFRTVADEELRRAFWAAADHLTAVGHRETVAVTGSLLSLVGLCVQRLDDTHDEPVSANGVAVKIRRLLTSRVNDRLSIGEIARELAVSPTTAKESFRNAFGTGIITYHN